MAASVTVYFIDAAGVRYRVYDVAFGPPLAALGKRKILQLCDVRGRYRLFVQANPESMMRVHDLGRHEGERRITAEILDAQLRRAGFAPKKIAARDPHSPAPYLGG